MNKPNPQYNGYAIASLVIGIISVVLGFCGILSLVGLVLGIIGIVLAVKGRQSEKKGLGTAGLVLSIIGVVFGGLMALCVLCFAGAVGIAGISA